MNHQERIDAALRGQPVDRVPVALWRHFPNDDQSAEGLAARVVEFQNRYDFDLVKVTPASGYPAEMYGATFVDGKNREGTRSYTARPVNRLDDWDQIQPLSDNHPVVARETAALERIRRQLGPDIPVLQTLFGPLNSAHNLAGERTFQDLRRNPEVIERALRALTQTTIDFALASLKAGADAIFFATQMAKRRDLSEEEFARFSEPYDLQVIEAIRAVSPKFILLHIHGLDIYFDRLAKWPVDAINWHDRRTAPSLEQARGIFKGMLLGGLNEWETLTKGSPDDVRGQAQDAIRQTGGRGFVLAAGCVIPVDTPDENIRAAIQATQQ